LPVSEKYWRQHELWDGTYTFEDLIEINTVITTKTKIMTYLAETAAEKIQQQTEQQSQFTLARRR
jgi:hypothetical protein